MTVPSKSKNAPTRGPGGEASTSAISCSSVHTARRAIPAALLRPPPPAVVPWSAVTAAPPRSPAAPRRPTRRSRPPGRRRRAPAPPPPPGAGPPPPPRRGAHLADPAHPPDDVPHPRRPLLPAAGQLVAARVDQVEVGGQPER